MNDLNTVTDIMRSINLILGLLVLGWLLVRRIRRRAWYDEQPIRNDIWFMAFYWLTASLVGTFEVLFNTGTTIRVAFVFVAILITFKILLMPQKAWQEMNA